MGIAPERAQPGRIARSRHAPRADGGERSVYEGSHLKAIVSSDRQLLAMKLRAHREQCLEDMRILAQKAGASKFEQVRDIHDR